MEERTFNGLIVRHRKSAVFFYRKVDLSKCHEYKGFRGDKEPIVYLDREELELRYYFDKQIFNELLNYLEVIALESWKGFEPKVADSFGADHDHYYDKEFEDEGSCGVNSTYLHISGPNQQVSQIKNECARLYKFNKRKLESFVYDLRKALEDKQ